jgi:hypothetical protein
MTVAGEASSTVLEVGDGWWCQGAGPGRNTVSGRSGLR